MFPEMLKILQEDLNLLLSFVPIWAIVVEKGLDPTMYGTGSYEGDLKVKMKVDDIIWRYNL